MSRFETATIALGVATFVLAVVTTLAIPAYLRTQRRNAEEIKRRQRIEDLITGLADDVSKLVTDEERAHIAMYAQMREDRRNADRRLRALEKIVRGPRNQRGAT